MPLAECGIDINPILGILEREVGEGPANLLTLVEPGNELVGIVQQFLYRTTFLSCT